MFTVTTLPIAHVYAINQSFDWILIEWAAVLREPYSLCIVHRFCIAVHQTVLELAANCAYYELH